ncbi:hypothetical protein Bca52824_024107 [Brassica carinata]|uniref:Uncharacterized protein n=1 Tax=Brassica carinata TaxID=52824 RepID=A0A8X8AU11_BRACI|nr:hypothetical protein Bca52824_024107 [Brassica carinata]
MSTISSDFRPARVSGISPEILLLLMSSIFRLSSASSSAGFRGEVVVADDQSEQLKAANDVERDWSGQLLVGKINDLEISQVPDSRRDISR